MYETIRNKKTSHQDRSVNAKVFKETLFKSVSASHRLVHRKPQSLAVFPRHFTSSRKYFNFQEEVFSYMQALPKKIDSSGFFDLGSTTDASPLLTTMPFHAQYSYPLVDNTAFASNLGIVQGFESSEHELIFSDIMDLLHKDHLDISVKINKGSSSGPVTFEKDVQFKLAGMEHFVLNFDDIMKFIKKGDLKGLFDKHGFLFYSTTGSRIQQDKAEVKKGVVTGKPRPVFDRLYAMTSGNEGKTFVADKDLANSAAFNDQSDFTIPHNKRTMARVRLVYGYQTAVVQVINQTITPMIEENHKRYEKTFKTRGHDDLNKSLSGSHQIFGLDVSNHDVLIQGWMLSEYIDRLPVSEDLKIIITLLARAPYMRPPLNDGDEPIFSADPFDINSYDHNIGLPSGMGLHSAFGKAFMTFSYVIMITDLIGYKGKDWLNTFLEGNDPDLLFKDSVDDALYSFKRDSTLCRYIGDLLDKRDLSMYKADFKGTDKAKKRIFENHTPSPYHIIEKEQGIAYLGSQISRNPFNNKLHIGPSIINYVKNYFMPESGVHASTRMFWFTGFEQRRSLFAEAINGQSIIQKVDSIFEDTMGEHPMSIVQHFKINNKQLIDSLIEPVTAIELEVSLDPSKLQWKYMNDNEHIRSEFAEQFVTAVPVNLRHAIFAKFIRYSTPNKIIT